MRKRDYGRLLKFTDADFRKIKFRTLLLFKENPPFILSFFKTAVYHLGNSCCKLSGDIRCFRGFVSFSVKIRNPVDRRLIVDKRLSHEWCRPIIFGNGSTVFFMKEKFYHSLNHLFLNNHKKIKREKKSENGRTRLLNKIKFS